MQEFAFVVLGPLDQVTGGYLFDRRLVEELRSADVALALYPLSAFRAMNAAALRVYEAIRRNGTQKDVLETMQTREELYDFLDYHAYEQKLDQLFRGKKP